jgi:hypothetical protein
MTSPPSDKRDRWKEYREDVAWFFQRHPVAHFVSIFCLLFTLWSLLEAFGSSSRVHSARGAALDAAFYAGFVSVLLFFIQRWRRKRDSAGSRDA